MESRQNQVDYQVRRTLLEMLKDRGYYVTADELEETYEQYIEKKASRGIRHIFKRPIGTIEP